MRPNYSALVHKLRQMKLLEDPYFARMVIDDMIYHRFIFQEKHPNHLWFLLQQIHSYWIRSIDADGATTSGEERQKLFLETEKGDILNLNEDASQKVEIDLDSKELKRSAREQIALHTYDPTSRNGVEFPVCHCGRQFDLFEEWANHTRSVIWKVLRESANSSSDHSNKRETPDQEDQADQ
jgi:hypothetical protein